MRNVNQAGKSVGSHASALGCPPRHSGDDNWPVNIGGVVNTACLVAGRACGRIPGPAALRRRGWIGLTLINGIIHVVSAIRLRIYNPGLVTGIVLFLPFTIFVLALEVGRGALSGADVGVIALLGVLLHLPVAALLVVPFLKRRRMAAARAHRAH